MCGSCVNKKESKGTLHSECQWERPGSRVVVVDAELVDTAIVKFTTCGCFYVCRGYWPLLVAASLIYL